MANEAQVHVSFFTEGGKQVEFLMYFTDYSIICNPNPCVTTMSPMPWCGTMADLEM